MSKNKLYKIVYRTYHPTEYLQMEERRITQYFLVESVINYRDFIAHFTSDLDLASVELVSEGVEIRLKPEEETP